MEEESQNARDARVEKLWKNLHTGPIAPLDFEGLKAGLQKIDHPLANSGALLHDVFELVDTSGDGRIEYEEFRTFVEQTEKELWQLFKSIDRDRSGTLDKDELRAAFKNAGVDMNSSKLERFFSEIDKNNDGSISFDEWRDFLLFLPVHVPNLKAVLSYYSSTVFSSSELDTHVSDEGASGLGNSLLFSMLFGVFLQISNYRAPTLRAQVSANKQTSTCGTTHPPPLSSQPGRFPWDPGEEFLYATMAKDDGEELLYTTMAKGDRGMRRDEDQNKEERMLISLFPDPGYFLAGGIAGAVSRTATAPLDRLKVYLIAQTSATKDTKDAVKSGQPVKAVKHAARPLRDAVVELWRMGGVRSLFAGNGLNVIKVMPESAIKFGSYEATKKLMARIEGHGDPRNLGPWSQFFAAGMGGVIAQLAVYPLDTLKFRMQCETVEGGLTGNALIKDTAKKMMSGSGVRSFYRGLALGLGGMFPYSAIDLTTYEYLKRTLTARKARLQSCSAEDAAPGRMMTGAIGAVSSAFGATIVYPVNLIRTRLQSQGTVIHPPTYTGWKDCLARTVKGEGFWGLYKGLTPNLLKVVPSMSISYMMYETSKKFLHLK